MKSYLWAVLTAASLATGTALPIYLTDGPLTPWASLKGRTDENGYLRISAGTAGVTDGPLTAMAALRVRTDENGYLRVSCDDCGGSGSGVPGGSSGQLQYNAGGGNFGGTAGGTVAAGVITLVAPILGTPASGNLVNATGYPIASVANLAAGVATFLTTPSSANLITAVTNETGTGLLVFGTTPTLTTPVINAGTGTSLTMTGVVTAAGLNQTYVSKTTDYPLTASDGTVELLTNIGTFTLPTPVGIQGRMYTLKNLQTANDLTVATAAGTIDGSATATVTGTSITVQSDNTNWRVIATGGGNIPATVQGDLIYASATNVFSALNKNTSNSRYLQNQGTNNNPVWAQVNVANGITGTVPVANGGTGLTAGTSGGVPTYTAAGTLTSSGALTAGMPVLGGGAGAVVTVGTISGNTTKFATMTGSIASGNCVKVDASGNLQDYGGACNAGAGGASAALDNLAAVSINTSLLAQTGVDLGSTTNPFRDLYLWGSGTFATTYLKLTGTPTSTRTLTLPNATDTLVGKATTDVLTNKTLSDSTSIFGNVSDNSKAAKFSLGGATASTTLTLISSQTVNQSITFPNATGTLPIILASSGAATTPTSNTSETNQATITVPANTMGANGKIVIDAVWKYVNANGAKHGIIRVSTTPNDTSTGTVYLDVNTSAGSLLTWAAKTFWNANSTSAQATTPTIMAVPANINSTTVTSAIDTTAVFYIMLNGYVANASDTNSLISYTVTLYPGT